MATKPAVNLEAIPHESKELPRWVNWAYLARSGKRTKVPLNLKTGRKASCTDSATWGTFEQALDRLKRGLADGIGFQLGPPYSGIDLDECRNAETGAIEPWAAGIITKLNSYTEVSPSGTGLHIITKGGLPPGARRKGQVEMYDTARYFTVTGRHLDGSPKTVEERSRALNALHRQIFRQTSIKRGADCGSDRPAASMPDAELIERARHAKNGGKFAQLWTGNWTGYDSHSEADLAICMILAFWTDRNPGRIDALFRRSGLYRDKWDERHGADDRTYGQITIEKAIAETSAVHGSGGGRENATPEVGLVKRLADDILLTEHFAQDPGGKLYRFNGGVYKPDGSAHVKRLVKRLLEEWNLSKKWSSARAEEVVEYLRVDAQTLWERPSLNLVNLQNGLLDVETGELREHSPHHLSCVQLPIAYDPAARCTEWENFVDEVFPADGQELAWQIVAWLMRPDVSLQKAVLLLGEGGNGKSTYLTALTNFLGHSNVSAISLHRLESDRFSVARLVGKLANICPDLPSSHLVGTSTFKALTGGDTVLAEYKYQNSFEFVPFVRLVFSANHAPRSGDASQAFFRRWRVVPFTSTFEGGAEIPRPILDARLAAPRELSGVLNKAVQALRQLQEQGGLIESESMAAAGEEFRNATDPVAVWVDRWTIEQSESFVPKDTLLSAYNSAAAKEGSPAMTKTGFGLALRRLRPNIQDGQRTVAGKSGVWVWLCLGLRSSEND